MQPLMLSVSRGAKAKKLAHQALECALYDPNRVFVSLFEKMRDSYSSKEMSQWVVGIAYDGETPVASSLSTDMWVGVYVIPERRRQKIATQLLKYMRGHVVSFHSCTDDPQALAFFATIGCSPL